MARADERGWSFLERMRRDLRESMQIGAALAGVVAVIGCGGETQGAPTDGPDETAGSGGAAGDVETMAQQLAPVPEGLLGCAGPTYDAGFGLHGQCCFTPRCYEPSDGAACSENYEGPEVGFLLPSESGTCSCKPDERPRVSGPFAPNPSASIASSPEGSCCYVIASIGCDGRPFVVNETQRVAPRAWRDDWGLPA